MSERDNSAETQENFRIASLYKTRYNNYNIVLWIRC